MSKRALAWAMVFCGMGGAGCGSSASAGDNVGTAESEEVACSAAPRVNADGTATMAGCAYEQHTSNIVRNGRLFAAAGAVLRDASGAQVGTVIYGCGRWYYGKDVAGTSIIVDRQSGEVQSHGMFHAGQSESTLSTISMPIAVDGAP